MYHPSVAPQDTINGRCGAFGFLALDPITSQRENTAEPLYEVFKPEKEQQTMPIFSKLFKHLPDADKLLSLEPEQLAGYLLVSLEGREEIMPEYLIKRDEMEKIIRRNSHINPKLNYSPDNYKEVLLALMEAWQCLLSEGFVAQKPTDLHTHRTSTTKYFVTRRGKKIETLEDFKDYRKADLLLKHRLHPIIAEKVWFIFAQGSYDTAVFECFKQVEIAVREAGGYAENDRGTDLMRKAFNVDAGNLTDQSRLPAVKQAMSDFLAGAIGLYKNPSSHHEVEFAPEEAAEIIIIASHLLRIVDTCAERTSNASN